MSALEVPVVFLIFNRPELTERVFAAIREARPRTLLVVADGPRTTHPDDAAKVAATRAVVEKVDWPCTVVHNYSSANLGCAVRVSTGITWAFSQVEEAIILEDDCVPHPSFFRFCANLLEYYRNDTRVMHIGGINLQNGIRRTPYSYFFSKIPHIWGWATWRRAWRLYDLHFEGLEEFLRLDGMIPFCSHPDEREYWTKLFRDASTRLHTWDAQWVFALWKNNALAALPEVNLISNIGFGPEATHTFTPTYEANIRSADIGEIQHPLMLLRCVAAEEHTIRYAYKGKWLVPPPPPTVLRSLKKAYRRIRGLVARAICPLQKEVPGIRPPAR